jgi:heterodisulfide reductase subunit A
MNKKKGKALVVGAGISGIRSALDLAEFGYGVTLIDRDSHLGGVLSQLDYQFPTDRCGMCKMLPLTDRDASSQYCLRKGLFHENIDIRLGTELIDVDGEPGRFEVLLKEKPRWVDAERCIGCGDCVTVCPIEIPDAFNAGMGTRKAIFRPIPHSIPNSYTIDFTACTRCGECEKVCPTDAIHVTDQKRQEFNILITDDELVVRDSLKEWLEDEGFFVEMAASGPEALEMLALKTYQLLLTDIKMPGMDGVELLERAKEKHPDLYVVMMTAYATVETAVEAMKIGALDYLMKPFDPDVLIPKVLQIYEDVEISQGQRLEVGAIVFSGGVSYYDPAGGKDPFEYDLCPDVVTSLEFERLFSGVGPTQGKLVRPSNGKPVRKVAWIQCVGSRDLQTDADFCSNICCMYAIKEARVAKEKYGNELETTIFYMDMRTFGKSYQRYRDQAENDYGVGFIKGRVHSVTLNDKNGQLLLRYVNYNGAVFESHQDMVVLAVGQRPAADAEKMAETLGIELNPQGFCKTQPFSMCQAVDAEDTARQGIVVSGAFNGLKDISETVIQASSASVCASRVIHAAGGSLAPEISEPAEIKDVSSEFPRILIAICTCGSALTTYISPPQWQAQLQSDPAVMGVELLDQTCTALGWDALIESVRKHAPNRVLIGACQPYLYARKLRELGERVGLAPALIDVVDIRSPVFTAPEGDEFPIPNKISAEIARILTMGVVRLKSVQPSPTPCLPVEQRALIVGGGIAGMTAALAIADHGFETFLIEKEADLGGNLRWLTSSIQGDDLQALCETTCQKVTKHPLIHVHTQTEVIAAYGQVGHFFTTIENRDGEVATLEHGVAILAAGGDEAVTKAYNYGSDDRIITQKKLEIGLREHTIDPVQFKTVVMIQCVDSREEPRNYCSRICCVTALKHALDFKALNPEITVYVLYRDMMSYGFNETYFTQAREAGVIFIAYTKDQKPEVTLGDENNDAVQVVLFESILGQNVQIDADLLVLATGVTPDLPPALADAFGADRDQDGFFQEAESKWRPVDAIKEGVFACGLVHSPRNVTETIATAEAAAQRALRILCRKHLPAGKVVAIVRHSLCSLCERCIDACPYGARTLDIDAEKVEVNPVMCQGCGSCASVCPNSASVVEGFEMPQMFGLIDAAMLNG